MKKPKLQSACWHTKEYIPNEAPEYFINSLTVNKEGWGGGWKRGPN